MKKHNRNAAFNFLVPLAVIAGLAIYFTVKSQWGAGAVIIIALLALIAGFNFWLWRKFF